MARVREVEVHEVPDDVRPVYERFARDYGPFLNQVKVFAQRPPVLKHVMGLLLELADEALLPKRSLEIALVVVSKLNECTYCVAHHTPRLVDQGLAADTVARILDADCPGLTPLDRLVRDYAVQVTTEPNRIRDGVFAELRTHFTEAQIVELTVRTALCGFFNRVNDALGIGIEDGVIEEMLAKGGRREDLAAHHTEKI
jgi:uncharacterized peroxidase-related enzyme